MSHESVVVPTGDEPKGWKNTRWAVGEFAIAVEAVVDHVPNVLFVSRTVRATFFEVLPRARGVARYPHATLVCKSCTSIPEQRLLPIHMVVRPSKLRDVPVRLEAVALVTTLRRA